MLDLFSGLGGANQAMRDHGWRVISVELKERFKPTVVADVRHLPLQPFPVDLLWASVPCTEYARESMPWCRKGIEPDHSLYLATRQVIAEWAPRFWAIENVRGAARYWGRPSYRFGPVYIWTNLPMLGRVKVGGYKERLSGSRSDLRSLTPYQVSEAIAAAVESLTEAAA
jgi:hypothetical protein